MIISTTWAGVASAVDYATSKAENKPQHFQATPEIAPKKDNQKKDKETIGR